MLKESRIKAGLTQAQVAALLGATRQQISSWETGVRPISKRRVTELAVLLRLHPKSLATFRFRSTHAFRMFVLSHS